MDRLKAEGNDADQRFIEIDLLEHLRGCRAIVLNDSEAFQRAAVGLEHAAQLTGAPVELGLAGYRDAILGLIGSEDEAAKREAESLFEVIREARNMAVHEGAWVRTRSKQLVELLLLLEEATLSKLTTVEHFMVKDVTVAESYHRLAHARRLMLSNSFSVLPVLTDHWRLLCDEAIVTITRNESNTERKRRLSMTIQDAVATGLKLIDAQVVSPDKSVSSVVKDCRGWPMLVTEGGSIDGRLLGIITPFDLL